MCFFQKLRGGLILLTSYLMVLTSPSWGARITQSTKAQLFCIPSDKRSLGFCC